jgi:hypothetical protein
MISIEEEKSKILLDKMPYLRPLYIKGILSMYKILSISWKESLINIQNKFKNLKNTNISNNNNTNINTDSELNEIKNKMFLIFSFMNYFYQMIDKGKFKKFEGLDYIYTKLMNFYTFSRQIISYKLLDINYEEFNQKSTILKLIIHVKLFYIFCEYDTYKSQEEFIDDLLQFLSPKEIIKNKDNKDNEDNNNVVDLNEEEAAIEDLIKDIKMEGIELNNIFLFVNDKYNCCCERYKNYMNDNKYKYKFFTILYESYFDLKANPKDYVNENKKGESSDEDEDKDIKNYEKNNNNKNNNSESSNDKKKKKKRKNKKKNKNKDKDIPELNDNQKNIIKLV